MPGILGRNQINALQYLERPATYVTQVTDRCGDNIQPGIHDFPLSSRLPAQAVAGYPFIKPLQHSMRHIPHRSRASLACALALLLVAGCASTPQTESPVATPLPQQPPPDARPLNLDMPISDWDVLFSDAENALAARDWMTADTALAKLPPEVLNDDEISRRDYLLARVAYLRGDAGTTRELLASLDSRPVHPAIAYRVANFQRHVLTLAGDYLGSARIGAAMLPTAPQPDRPGLRRSLWANLERTDGATLARALAQSSDPAWSGWLALAQLSRQDRPELASGLADWQQQYPGHAAAAPLPGGMDYLRDTPAPPGRVALLLPLSGRLAPAGKAVRDGYLASYFHSRGSASAPQDLVVIDTDRYDSATMAYNEAVAGGASFVVGPLDKDAVAEVAALAHRAVPVLALNRTPSAPAQSGAALVQLSLAPEDEARSVAELAFGSGARRALLLRPAGPWGDDMEAALRTRWQSLGGSTADVATYTGQEEYSGAVKDGLGIAASELRRRRVADMLASPVEFTPRRRQDLDVVFMLARSAAEARALKPLLAFHYAGGLPVYATSAVYGGREDPRDRDLDGLNLVELPWLLGSNPGVKASLDARGHDDYPRLQALGADAYRLQARFAQLRAGPDALLRGDTGLLTMNPQLHIQRELPAATFDGPVLKMAR